MKNIIDVLRRPIVTEKSSLMRSQNTYVIEVDPAANKHQIREAVETREHDV
jgi:large subunit ribosomal protein L23